MERRVVTAPPTTETCADGTLVSAARAGDRSAFDMLYARYARMVHGILLCRVPPREVDDLVQEVFLLALKKLHSLRDIARFGAWLSTITRNRANDYYRKTGPVDRVTDADAEEQVESRTND